MTESSPPHAAAEALAALARRLSGNPAYLAGVLDLFRAQEQLDEPDLAAYLGTSPEGLTRLALCKLPSSDKPEFAAQVNQIAKYAGVNPATLAQLIRQVGALGAMNNVPNSLRSQKSAPQSTQTQLGWLAAARDRTDSDEDPQEADDEGPPEQGSGT